jgi:subtilisin family serine protease
MFRSPSGRKFAGRARAARRIALVFSLFVVAAGLPYVNAGAWQQDEEIRPLRSPSALKGQANIIEGADYVPGEVLVRFRTDAAAKTAEEISLPLRAAEGEEMSLERFGGSEIVSGLRLAKVDPAHTLEAVAELAARPDVLYAEPNYLWRAHRTPNDPCFNGVTTNCFPVNGPVSGYGGGMYGLNKINAPGAWERTTGDKSVVVGVIDEGIDVQHPDLAPNIWVNPAEGELPNGKDEDGNGLIDDNNGWDFVNNDRTVYDGPGADDDDFPTDGHGTHVAGTIGAKGNNNLGVTGVNWDVSIISIKVLGPQSGSVSGIINGYNYAHQLRLSGVNLRVLNNSYGGPGKSLSALDAIRRLNDVGILFVAAAGNDGLDNFIVPDYPSNYDVANVLSVAWMDSNDTRVSSSNFGARLVNIGAPGSSILSTFARTTAGSTYERNGYAFLQGTSMATPHVAGAAALVCAANPNISLTQLRGVLAFTGDRVSGLNGITTTGRRLNVANAVEAALEGDTTAPAPAGNFRITAQTGRNVTLAWTAPGDNGTGGLAVADYDLLFVNPTGGVTVLPLTLLPAAPGTQQSLTVDVPYRNTAGTLQLRAYDNVGNSSNASVSVAVSDFVAEPYTSALSAAQPLSTDATTNLFPAPGSDDSYASYALPFNFPFYGVNRSSLTVSTNGALYFANPPRFPSGGAADAASSPEGLNGRTVIAGLWDDIDLRTCLRADSGVYVSRPDANRLIFRWQGVPFSNSFANCPATPRTAASHVNFEIELRADGSIQFRYGQNPLTVAVVGISGGDPAAYVVSTHTRPEVPLGRQPINLSNAATVTFSPRVAQLFTISGSVKDANGAGVANVTVFLSGNLNASRVTDAGGNYSFSGVEGGGNYTLTPSHPGYNFSPASINIANLASNQGANFTATSNAPTGANSLGFAQASYNLNEGSGRVTLTVMRTGDTSGAATVNYRTADADNFTVGCADTVGNHGSAYARCDFATVVGTLSFAPGEVGKTIAVPLIDDAHVEGTETFQMQLSNATGTGTTLGAQSITTVTLADNDTTAALNPVISSIPFFVRMQYLDFLSREPEGGEPWSAVLARCPNIFTGPSVNTDCDRIAVSQSFFGAPEFRLKGFYAFRFYKLAFNRLPEYAEIVSDMSFVAGATEAEVYARRAQLAVAFTARPEFQAAYGGLTNQQFVETLLGRYSLGLVTTPDPATPDSGTRVTYTSGTLINQLNSNLLTRAQVFRAIADSDQVQGAEFNSAFVAVQYYGYLRRTPEPAGYQDNLNALLRGVSPREMVNAFLNSAEYRLRFGQP